MKKRNDFTTQTLLDFDLEESSSDSDFRIEDHDEESDDFSLNSKADGNASGSADDSSDSSSDESESDAKPAKKTIPEPHVGHQNGEITLHNLSTSALLAASNDLVEKAKLKLLATPICCACLGDRSDDTNEIVECDGCGVTVHEGCYGVSDSASVSSTVSSCSTEPWFCEACKADVAEPVCELCPNKGGIFKETDVGKWVHLVCALYVPGVAFGEVDQLSSVTLFEMQYSKWGSKNCSLCEDARFARTGVCIGCDAGMCKTYFHVTCAQSAGLLSEAHSEEVDHADPFYAHCKIHSDKTLVKHRKRNFNTLKLSNEHRRLEQDAKKLEPPTLEQQRIERKLKKHKTKYNTNKTIKSEPWVPTQKMPRLLTTSASACRRLILKAELMGIDTAALEIQEAQMAALADVRKKWHIPPAFSVEFIGYYLDRIARLRDIRTNLNDQLGVNKRLLDEQQGLREQYDRTMNANLELTAANTILKQSIAKIHADIQALCPSKQLPPVEQIGRSPVAAVAPPARPMAVPTAAALKMGVGFPLNNLIGTRDDTGRILSTQRQSNDELVHECGICKRCNDQHLLAKCDTCHFYYHLGCLNPPLTRHPKKSKLYGWQCSECDKSDDSEADVTLPKGPRKSRTRYSKDGVIVPCEPPDDKPSDASSTLLNGSGGPDEIDLTAPVAPHTRPPTPPLVSAVFAVAASATTTTAAATAAAKHKKRGRKNPTIKIPGTEPIHMPACTNGQSEISDMRIVFDSGSLAAGFPTPVPAKVKNKKSKKEKRHAPAMACTYYIENGIPPRDTIIAPSQFTSELMSMPSVGQPTMSADQDVAAPPIANSVAHDQQFGHKTNRKRRKEKHKDRSRHASDSEKTPTKEHKRKRKRKNHDMENPNSTTAAAVAVTNPAGPHPRIKIKFRAIPRLNAEPHFMFVSTGVGMGGDDDDDDHDMDAQVRPMEICRSRPGSADLTAGAAPVTASPLRSKTPLHHNLAGGSGPAIVECDTPAQPLATSSPTPAALLPRSSRHLSICGTSPRKAAMRKEVTSESGGGGSSKAPSTPTVVASCDVCEVIGTPQNLVRCDECKKCYHFTCLDPPLKKTPKRRGYSWHCADCDPTEVESN